MFTSAGLGGYQYNISLGYNVPGDVTGVEGSMKYSVYNGTTWTAFASTAGSGTMTVSSTLTNTNAPFLNTDVYTGRDASTPLTYYKSVINGDWNNVNTWVASTDPNFVSPAGTTPAAPPTSANSVSVLVSTGTDVQVSGNNTAITATRPLREWYAGKYFYRQCHYYRYR